MGAAWESADLDGVVRDMDTAVDRARADRAGGVPEDACEETSRHMPGRGTGRGRGGHETYWWCETRWSHRNHGSRPKVVKPPRVPERWKSREPRKPRKPRGRPGFGGVRAAVLQQSVAVRRALGAVLVCDPRVLPAPVVHCPALPARAAPERFGRSRARLLGTPIESACRVCLLTSNGLTGRTVPCTHAPLHVLLYAVACSVVCPVAHMIPRPSRHCRPELSFPRAR